MQLIINNSFIKQLWIFVCSLFIFLLETKVKINYCNVLTKLNWHGHSTVHIQCIIAKKKKKKKESNILYFCFFFSTDGAQVTWNEPLPILTVQQSDSSLVFHRNHTRLIEGSTDAALSWHFSLSSDLTLNFVFMKLGTVSIAVVNGQKQEVLENFRDKYAINWIPNQRITLVIFNVTTEHNATFVCEVIATKSLTSIWTSHVQVDVVGRVNTNVIQMTIIVVYCSL